MEEIKTGVFKINKNIPVYVIGDIHGDYQCLIHCLVDLCMVASVGSIENDSKFDEKQREILEWENENCSVVIFCGDLIHRKRFQNSVLDDECSDIFIIETLLRLKKSANLYGGDIIIISGNHEIMNIMDPTDTTYLSDKNIIINKKYFTQIPFINNYISQTYAWIKLNDIVIAHGGLCSEYLKFLDTEDELKKQKKNIIGGSANNKNNANNKNSANSANSKNSANNANSKNNANSANEKLNFLSSYNIMIGGNLYEYGDDIIEFVNDKYRNFFTDYSLEKSKIDPIGFKLFADYDYSNGHKHNVFWCREWGYSGINCDNLNKTIEKIGCNKMIIAHCPQFLPENKSKMINFECEDISGLNSNTNSNTSPIIKYKIARVDLGMSRSFEYNNLDNFFKFLSFNYNRKMAVLKLSWDKNNKNYYFNCDSIITKKISCLQYLLIKYGITKKEWEEKNIHTDWLGFEYIDKLIKKNKSVGVGVGVGMSIEMSSDIDTYTYTDTDTDTDTYTYTYTDMNIKCSNSSKLSKSSNSSSSNDIMMCLLYPLYFNRPKLKSVFEFINLL